MEAASAREAVGARRQRAAALDVPAARRCPGARTVVGLVGLAFLLLGLAWVVTSPVPAGIDEPAQYIRALGVAQGEFSAPRALYPVRDPNYPDVLYMEDQSTRLFTLPAKLAPAAVFSCTYGPNTTPATCTTGSRCLRWVAQCTGDPPSEGTRAVVSYVGDYEPTWYLVPGLAAHLAGDDVEGLRAARLGGLLIAIGVLVVAGALLWDAGAPGYSLLGLVVAFTPMALHVDGVLNASGGEIVLSIAFAASMMRIWRDRERTRRWVWVAAGVTGALLAVSRVFGTLWVLVAIATLLSMTGVRPAFRVARAGGGAALFAMLAIAAGLAGDRLWWVYVGTPHFRESPLLFPQFLSTVARGLPAVFGEQVGVFSWGNLSMPIPGLVIWAAMVIALLTLAVVVGTRRQRVVLIGLVIADVLATLVIGAILRVGWDYRGTGIAGRYILPFTVILILAAGESLRANRAKLGTTARRRLFLYAAIGAAAAHFMAFWIAARRFAVGVDGPLFFVAHPAWRPPLGWWPWIAIALLGCGALVAAGALAVRAEARRGRLAAA